jgi:hypothetical protein
LLNVLFSSDRGLFTWAPVTLPALIGLRWLSKINARLTIILLGMLVSQLYVVSSWFTWSGGVAFGPRFWVGLTVLFGLGLAALVDPTRVSKMVWIVAASLLILWNFLLIIQYSLETIPRSGPVDMGLMVRNQFMVIPENLQRIVRALITRRS